MRVFVNFSLHLLHLMFNCLFVFLKEFNDAKEYGRNLGRIKRILLKTGAAVSFALTTPVPYNTTKNDMVIQYNEIAER